MTCPDRLYEVIKYNCLKKIPPAAGTRFINNFPKGLQNINNINFFYNKFKMYLLKKSV